MVRSLLVNDYSTCDYLQYVGDIEANATYVMEPGKMFVYSHGLSLQ